MFRTEMWKLQANFDMHIDDHLEALNEHTREAASLIFGSHKDTPPKTMDFKCDMANRQGDCTNALYGPFHSQTLPLVARFHVLSRLDVRAT